MVHTFVSIKMKLCEYNFFSEISPIKIKMVLLVNLWKKIGENNNLYLGIRDVDFSVGLRKVTLEKLSKLPSM